MRLKVNGRDAAVPPDWRDESLLDVLREALGLVGAKYGCGVGLCGACTVLVDGEPARACLLRAAEVGEREVTTVEGLARGGRLHPVQQAWLDEAVPQCGYCQAGQVIATVALLRAVPSPGEAELEAALDGHLCRCATQQRIRDAVRRAAEADGGRT